MRFEKWQALGNDYVIVERDELPWELTPVADPPALRTALRHRLRRDPAAGDGERLKVRRRAADLQPRRVGGRALRERGAGSGAVPPLAWVDGSGDVLDHHEGRRGDDDDHRSGHGGDGDRAGVRDLGRLPVRARRRHGHAGIGRARVGLPARPGREPAVRDRGRGRPRGARPRRGGPGRRVEHGPLPQPDQRVVLDRRRLDCEGPDLRARGGGDPLIRNRRQRSRGRRVPAWGGEPDHGQARRRRADRGDHRRTST